MSSARKLLLSVTCFLLTPMLFAQSLTTGEVAGSVADPSGGVMPGSIVTLKSVGTGTSQERRTNGQGNYRFPLLSPGTYLLTAKAVDFAPAQRLVQVRVGQIATVDLQLPLQTAVVSIEVHEAVTAVQRNTPNITSNATTHQLAEVPNPGNDMTFYALLAPGVQLSTNGANGGTGNFSSFGLPATSNTFTLN